MTNPIQKHEPQITTHTCHAFCPLCGTDLYYQDNECTCKNKECSWTCNNCHTDITTD